MKGNNMKHFKSLLILLMVLIAVPVLSADLETVGGFFSTVGDILSNTKVLSIAGILSAASAYFFRNVDVEKLRRTGSRHGFLGGRWLSIKATAVPGFGTAWTLIVEKWVAKLWTLLTAYLISVFIGFPVGLASVNNQKEPEK